jgi:16S rRNA (cytidine1402-2'-O)-methyltransferase
MLYLVATPLGNLADITQRALEILRTCDYVLCEDTRRSQRLLSHYQIQKPLKSYHKFNERRRESEILSDLKAGSKIALISDAGTPGISDPGEPLVNLCHQEGIEVNVIPGPCALVAALTLSGFSTERFQFVGFLPRKQGALTRLLNELLAFEGTSVCYESPYRLLKSLALLAELAPERELAVARELTKLHEEIRRGTAAELVAHYKAKTPKGEIVLLINSK